METIAWTLLVMSILNIIIEPFFIGKEQGVLKPTEYVANLFGLTLVILLAIDKILAN